MISNKENPITIAPPTSKDGKAYQWEDVANRSKRIENTMYHPSIPKVFFLF
jgi:hypothetical protein